MRLPDGTILMHADHAPYDPRKAHEYYLRTRKLKGRRKGSAQPPPAQRSQFGRKAAKPAPKRHTQISDLSPQQKQEMRAYAAQRVKAAQSKLTELNKKLKEKMAEAKKAERDAKKPPTASEKAKAAREAKKYRQSHKTELKSKAKAARAKAGGGSDSKGKTTSDSISGLKKQIAAAEKELAVAKAKQKALA